ncbi:MAG: cytochrome c biogenesis protein ResB [Bacillota bacterium]
MRFNLFLLLIIAGVSVFGTIIPQGEETAFYRQAYGPLRANLIGVFQLDDVFHSWWFLALAFLLTASILACSLSRLAPLWRQATTFQYRYREEEYTGAAISSRAVSPKGAGETAHLLSAGLRKKRYRVFLQEKEGRFYLYADRGRFGYPGTLVTHLSLVVIVAGALYGGLAGFKDYANISEGEAYHLQKAGFSVNLDDFRVDYYDDYMPKQYYSDLRIIDGGREVIKKTIAVNDPLTYKGVTFYQTSYGWVVEGVVNNPGKETKVTLLDRQTAPLGEGLSVKAIFYPDFFINAAGHPGTKSPLPNNPRVVYVVYYGPGVLTYDVTKLNEPVQIGDSLVLTFTGYRQYTGLKLARDPGIPVVYSGLTLLLLGLFLNFYVIPRRIWAMVSPDPSGSRILLAGSSPRFPARLKEDTGGIAELSVKESCQQSAVSSQQ